MTFADLIDSVTLSNLLTISSWPLSSRKTASLHYCKLVKLSRNKNKLQAGAHTFAALKIDECFLLYISAGLMISASTPIESSRIAPYINVTSSPSQRLSSQTSSSSPERFTPILPSSGNDANFFSFNSARVRVLLVALGLLDYQNKITRNQ